MKIQLKSKVYRLSVLPILGVALCASSIRVQADAPIEMPPSFATVPMQIGSDAFLWRVHLVPGAKYQVRYFARSINTQNIPPMYGGPAQTVDTRSLQRMVIDYDVLSLDRFGASTIRATYRDMTVNTETKVNGHLLAGPVQAGASFKVNQYLAKAYKNQSLEIKLGPDGTTWSIVGLEGFRSRLSQLLEGLAPQELARSRRYSPLF